MSESPIKSYIDELERRIREFQDVKVRCGLIGTSGSGKSSLINAIAGEKIAPVGILETTNEPQEFLHGGLMFVDLPGCGTPSWPRETYLSKLQLDSYDCFILVTAERFRDDDLFLYRELTCRGLACFVVHNKFDSAIADGAHDNSLPEKEVRANILQNITVNLAPESPDRIYLVSARHPTRYDLAALQEDIEKKLEGIKRSRFVADMGAYGSATLRAKRAVSEERVVLYSALSAANGLNPLPGLDISVDAGILLKMGQEVAHIYGLTGTQIDFIKRFLGPDAIPLLLAKIAQFISKYLAQEGIIFLLKQMGQKVGAKSAARWIPLVGPVIATSIGFAATKALGDQLVHEAEKLTEEILDGMRDSIHVGTHE
ncbi:MAG: 50S ribosome-binding GTPase [Verrucomicrobia bacterium]|nr:50S ribosome-binding GTPase [Verrucomicrobiota bacterium]